MAPGDIVVLADHGGVQHVDDTQLADPRAHGRGADQGLGRRGAKADGRPVAERVAAVARDADDRGTGLGDDVRRLQDVLGLAGVGDQDSDILRGQGRRGQHLQVRIRTGDRDLVDP